MRGTLIPHLNLALAQKRSRSTGRVISQVKSDYIPHYCYIFDRSTDGAIALRDARRIVDGGLSARMNDKAVSDWMGGRHAYAVIQGSWGTTGGSAIYSPNLGALLSVDLPKIMKIIKSKGGLCSFVVGTNRDSIPQIQGALAKLQPQEM